MNGFVGIAHFMEHCQLCAQHLYAPPPPFSDYPSAAVPDKVEAVVMSEPLAKDASQRYSSMQAFADALEESYRDAVAEVLATPPNDGH